MTLRAHFARTFDRPDAPCHFAAHSHHPWPDVSFEAHQVCWRDTARLLDRKWAYIEEVVRPKARAHIARTLNLPDPSTIAFAPNTHELVKRILSCLQVSRPAEILATDSEFLSFERQIQRLEEAGLVRVRRVPVAPYESFQSRFVEAASRGDHALVYLSHVFFNSGYRVDDLAEIAAAIANPDSLFVVDGYHAFMAFDVDLQSIADRAFYIAGGYKYAMAGEGVCFAHCPPGYGPRPLDTGWYAGPDLTFPLDGRRFEGATYDPSGLYRFNAVQDFLQSEGLSPGSLAGLATHSQDSFLDAIADGQTLEVIGQPLLPPETAPRFLCFETPHAEQIVTHLATQGVYCDARGNRLRLGFSLYQSEADIARAADALRKAVT